MTKNRNLIQKIILPLIVIISLWYLIWLWLARRQKVTYYSFSQAFFNLRALIQSGFKFQDFTTKNLNYLPTSPKLIHYFVLILTIMLTIASIAALILAIKEGRSNSPAILVSIAFVIDPTSIITAVIGIVWFVLQLKQKNAHESINNYSTGNQYQNNGYSTNDSTNKYESHNYGSDSKASTMQNSVNSFGGSSSHNTITNFDNKDPNSTFHYSANNQSMNAMNDTITKVGTF